jgi:copper chaperone NosL
MRPRIKAGLAAVLLAISGCNQKDVQTAPPAPLEITSDATGHFCGMGLNEHPGPKGQIFVANRKEPYWFASVRETVAFTKLPEEPKDILAIYVNDMGKAASWAQPEPGTWIDAKRALYVIGSKRRGGMDANEAVPFGDEIKARNFAADNGGRAVRFEEIPDDYILGGPGAIADSSNPTLKE